MKIVNIIGGLGNQMFQYAFALGLQCEFPKEEVKININCFNGYPLHNGFELDKLFEVKLSMATVCNLAKYAYPWTHYRLWQIGRHFLPIRKSMVYDKSVKGCFSYEKVKQYNYFDGYWQSPNYFGKHADSIRQKMLFPKISDPANQKAMAFINTGKSAFIHVRRGDYMGHPQFGGICTLEYYQTAVEKMKKEFGFCRFLLFSNDLPWVRANIIPMISECEIMIVDWNRGEDSFRDMQLMSLCDGGVIANSSFSWWGAWLSGSNKIICPEHWCNDAGRHDDIYDISWTKVSSAKKR